MGAWPASSGRVPVAIARKSSKTGLYTSSPLPAPHSAPFGLKASFPAGDRGSIPPLPQL